MIQLNTNYNNLKESYLFYNIAQKTKKYLEENPGKNRVALDMIIGRIERHLAGVHERD